MATRHKHGQLQALISELKRASHDHEAPVWKAIAEDLERPTRRMPVVNLGKLNRCTAKDEYIVVPGKLLGDGELDHAVTVAALGFSGSASAKLALTKSTALTIIDIVKKDPKGKRVRIIA